MKYAFVRKQGFCSNMHCQLARLHLKRAGMIFAKSVTLGQKLATNYKYLCTPFSNPYAFPKQFTEEKWYLPVFRANIRSSNSWESSSTTKELLLNPPGVVKALPFSGLCLNAALPWLAGLNDALSQSAGIFREEPRKHGLPRAQHVTLSINICSWAFCWWCGCHRGGLPSGKNSPSLFLVRYWI